jgi:hypothetical protein
MVWTKKHSRRQVGRPSRQLTAARQQGQIEDAEVNRAFDVLIGYFVSETWGATPITEAETGVHRYLATLSPIDIKSVATHYIVAEYLLFTQTGNDVYNLVFDQLGDAYAEDADDRLSEDEAVWLGMILQGEAGYPAGGEHIHELVSAFVDDEWGGPPATADVTVGQRARDYLASLPATEMAKISSYYMALEDLVARGTDGLLADLVFQFVEAYEQAVNEADLIATAEASGVAIKRLDQTPNSRLPAILNREGASLDELPIEAQAALRALGIEKLVEVTPAEIKDLDGETIE